MAIDHAKLMSRVKEKRNQLTQKDKTKKLVNGRNRIRVLPGWRPAEPDLFWHEWGQHWIKNEQGEVKGVYVCTERTFGRPCQVCPELDRAMKAHSGDDQMLEVLGEGKAGDRFLINAQLLDSEDPNAVEILEIAKTPFNAYLGLFDDYPTILDLVEGRDIVITRTGTGVNTKYTVTPAPEKRAVPAAVAKQLHNLDEHVAQENPAELARALNAISAVSGVALRSTASAAPQARPKPAELVDKSSGEITIPTKVAVGAVSVQEVAQDDELESLLALDA